MSRDLRLQLVLDTLDKASAPLKKITGASSKTAKALKASRDQLKQLQTQQGKIASFERLKKGFDQLRQTSNKSAQALFEAQEATAALTNQIKKAKNPSEKLVRQFNKAVAVEQRLKAAHHENRSKLSALNSQLKATGLSSKNLAGEQIYLRREVDRVTKAMEKSRQKLAQVNHLQKQSAKVRAAGGNVRSQAGRLGGQAAVAGAAGGYLFKTQFLDTAAEFEDYEAVLKTVEGSSKKARKALAWTGDFAAKTPYQLDEITEAYVQLRAYGLEPTNGLLKTLGDTGSAMNKPIMQAVEAISDAITGENERLKEFGIRASKAGGMITYEYTDKAGNQQSLSAADDNRKQIEENLRTIWNEKFAGAMEERSKTWSGMMSNMSDQWTRFTNMVMAAGLFDWMKEKLGGLLDKVNQMAADGSLQALAEDWGQKLMVFAKGTWATITAISTAITTIADLVGGFENLIYILAGLKLSGLIGSLFVLGKEALPIVWKGLKLLFFFLKANPIVLLITAIATAGYLIYKNWDGIKAFFIDLWNTVSDLAGRFADIGSQMIDGIINGITGRLKALRDTVLGAAAGVSNWFKEKLGIRSPSRVFKQHGSDVMAGLDHGMQKKKITLDNSPPLRAAASAGGGGSLSIGEINVHATPGMDAEALAQMVRMEIMKLQGQQAASRRSRLTDED